MHIFGQQIYVGFGVYNPVCTRVFMVSFEKEAQEPWSRMGRLRNDGIRLFFGSRLNGVLPLVFELSTFCGPPFESPKRGHCALSSFRRSGLQAPLVHGSGGVVVWRLFLGLV